MAAVTPWQLEVNDSSERWGYLLDTELWTDCSIEVGSKSGIYEKESVKAHKIVLAAASPIFEIMFYETSVDMQTRNSMLEYLNGHLEYTPPIFFKNLLQYIYKGSIIISSFEMARFLWSLAQAFMLPQLIEQCASSIVQFLTEDNVCDAYSWACDFYHESLKADCLKFISTHTKYVINSDNFLNATLDCVNAVFNLDHLQVDSEVDLFDGLAKYIKGRQQRENMEPPSKRQRTGTQRVDSLSSEEEVSSLPSTSTAAGRDVTNELPTADNELEPSIKTALRSIRFLAMGIKEFSNGPLRSGLLTQAEAYAIMIHLDKDQPEIVVGTARSLKTLNCGIEPMPPGFSQCRQPRSCVAVSDTTYLDAPSANWDQIVIAMESNDNRRVKAGVEEALKILRPSTRIQEKMYKRIVNAVAGALVKKYNDTSTSDNVARLMDGLFGVFTPQQSRRLFTSAAMQPFCRLMIGGGDPSICELIILRIYRTLETIENAGQQYAAQALSNLVEIGLPLLIVTAQQSDHIQISRSACNLQILFSMKMSSILYPLPPPAASPGIEN